MEAHTIDKERVVCTRIFANFVVNDFFEASKKPLLDRVEYHRWLEEDAVLEFVNTSKFVKLLGNSKKLVSTSCPL